jgi:tRNA/rRNA methyltransferase
VELERITQVLLEALCISGYVQSPGEAAAQEKVRRLLRRMKLEKSDAELWLGMMRQILWKTKHPVQPDYKSKLSGANVDDLQAKPGAK